jgi:hypothetical protein
MKHFPTFLDQESGNLYTAAHASYFLTLDWVFFTAKPTALHLGVIVEKDGLLSDRT